MNVLVISSSPNADGLTARCALAAEKGIAEGGGKSEQIVLNQLHIQQCQSCDNGWGTCREQHFCQVEDDFQNLHARVIAADALVLVTPVYWGEMSESAKAFTDRLRRCEASRGEQSGLKDMPILAVAAAGGSGGGMISCLASMERWIQHIRGRVYDLIPVNRWSRPYKLTAIQAAGCSLVLRDDLK